MDFLSSQQFLHLSSQRLQMLAAGDQNSPRRVPLGESGPSASPAEPGSTIRILLPLGRLQPGAIPTARVPKARPKCAIRSRNSNW